MLNITQIDARDLSETWFLCLRKVLTEGRQYKIERGSYQGQHRKELDFVVIHIKNPGSRPLVPLVPEGVPPPSTMDYIEEYLPYLDDLQKAEGEQYTYGQFLESQIAEVIKMYKEDGQIPIKLSWSSAIPESINLSDPPCLRSIDTRISGGQAALHGLLPLLGSLGWPSFQSGCHPAPQRIYGG